MHYQDGQEVKLGDFARTAPVAASANYQVNQVLGVVVGGVPAAEACNLSILAIAQRTISPLGTGPWTPVNGSTVWCQTAKECVLICRAE